ncbi:hypothetical protein D3C85_1088560 [compost metagenome]
MCSTVSVKSLRFTSLANCSKRTRSISSSLNKFISVSKRSISTRIVRLATGAPPAAGLTAVTAVSAALGAAASGAGTVAATAAAISWRAVSISVEGRESSASDSVSTAIITADAISETFKISFSSVA